ncbi:MAG: UbiA family prenyltransferase [Candidatus Woesearchaeota archaeon]
MIIKLAKKIIDYFEDEKKNILLYILTFFFIVCIRCLLEIFSINKYPSIEFHYHYLLFYIVVLIPLIILFYFATREKIEKVSKIVLSFFITIFIGPIIDLLFFYGKDYKIEYLYPANTENLLISFITFFGNIKPPLSLGIRIEIAIILILSFIYFYIKTQKIIRSLFFVLLEYIIFFIFFSTPFFLFKISEYININVYNQINFHTFYLLNIFIFLIFLYYLYNKNKFIAIFKDSRFLRIGHFCLLFVLGIIIALDGNYNLTIIDFIKIFIIFIIIILAWFFSVFTNNISDFKIDLISNKNRPLIKGIITKKDYIILSIFSFIFVILFSILIDYYILFLALVFISVYFLYSMPPLRLKQIPLFSKVMIAFNTLICFLMGYYFITENFNAPFEYIVFIMVFFSLIINFIDIKDYKGDKSQNILTLPTLLGLKKSKFIIGIFFLSTHILAYFFFDFFYNIYHLLILTILGIIQFYFINKKKYSEKPIFISYLSLILLIIIHLIYFI